MRYLYLITVGFILFFCSCASTTGFSKFFKVSIEQINFEVKKVEKINDYAYEITVLAKNPTDEDFWLLKDRSKSYGIKYYQNGEIEKQPEINNAQYLNQVRAGSIFTFKITVGSPQLEDYKLEKYEFYITQFNYSKTNGIEKKIVDVQFNQD